MSLKVSNFVVVVVVVVVSTILIPMLTNGLMLINGLMTLELPWIG